MKTRKTSSIAIFVFFIAFMIGSFGNSYGRNKDEVKLIGKYGCTWKELTFKFSHKEDSKTIDLFGMTTLTEAIAEWE